MLHVVRRSLLLQLLSMYLLFVMIVLISGLGVNAVVEEQLRDDIQASDQGLAQEIALETNIKMRDAEKSLVKLGNLMPQATTPALMMNTFSSFQAANSNIDHIYWLDPVGILRTSWPPGGVGVGTEFSPPAIVQRARMATSPVFEVGIAVETTFNAGVILAEPIHARDGELTGIVAISLSLDELSYPLKTVIQAQQHDGRQLMISVLEANGELIATPDHQRILQTVLDELPGAAQALHGQTVSRSGQGLDGQDWFFSSVPVPDIGWAVVVQRPASEVLAVVNQFHFWLLAAVWLFAFGGLLFWLILLSRMIRPLQILAHQHQVLPNPEQSIPTATALLATRRDEVGELARSLLRLERDGIEKLMELRTLLETSNEVVRSLDPHAVVRKIIHEARKLIDVQAAAVLIPDEHEILHVLVSDGHSMHYNEMLSLSNDDSNSTPVLALRDGKPVQRLLGPGEQALSYEEGFRSVLAIPIISRHTGNVVLLVHRTEAHPFQQNEINLLLTFANYATLAWEHAVLYERSDERLREIARENKRLYQETSQEKQKLEAIMGSMRDGLILAGVDGLVLYANQAISSMVGITSEELIYQPISILYAALLTHALDPVACQQVLTQAISSEATDFIVEVKRYGQRLILQLRLFDVGDGAGQPIGRVLLLRDVTRERELDEFKSTLLAAVGHELRTPLASIKGYASTLLQEDVTWSAQDQHNFLQTISSEADRLAQLVSNLLDLSRQEAGLLHLKRTPTSIEDLIIATIERIHRPDTKISWHIPEQMLLVDIDSARIEVVLHNLVMNACAYGDGEIKITTTKKQDQMVVAVTNHGHAIPPDELPHIFDRFYRARHGHQQRPGGTGLGLTICKAFIIAHGCAIWAESSEESTTISFTLPLYVPSTPDDTPSSTPITIQE